MEYQGIERRVNPFLGIFFIFFVVGVLIYLNTFNSPFIYDDHHVVGDVTVDQAFERCLNPKRAIAHLSFAFNIYIGGQHVTSYHIVNTLIHIFTSFGIFLFLFLLLKSDNTSLPDKDKSNFFKYAFWGGIIFLVHPLATQSVSYICQRYTSLASFFCIMALVHFLYARQVYGYHYRFCSCIHLIYYLFSIAFSIFAMLTKEFSVSLPLLVLLVEFCFLPKDFSRLLAMIIVDW